MTLIRRLFVAICCLLPVTVPAQSFYVGALVGTSGHDDSPPQIIGELDTDPSGRLLAGWTLHRNWAVEGSWHDFGSASGEFSPCAEVCTPNIPVSRRFAADAWSVRLAWRLGVARWQPFATVGWTRSDLRLRVRGAGSGVSVTNRQHDSGLSGELGLRLRWSGPLALRAGYEWFETLPADGGLFQFGAEWHF